MMKWKTFVIGYALALALLLFAQRRPERPTQTGSFAHIVDLTQGISRGKTTVSSVSHGVIPEPISAVFPSHTDRASDKHFPTRLQAPARYAPELWTVDQIPPERLFAPLAVIDMRAQVRHNPGYLLNVADIAAWEQAHGQIPQGAVVIARTGWASRWDLPRDSRNHDSDAAPHFPGFSLQAVKFLVQGRKVVGLGIDTARLNSGDAPHAAVSDYSLSHSVYQIENIANLDKAPEAGGLALVAPAKLQGSSSAPVRVLALAR